ncbi:MAG: phosphomannomutase [Actinomycetota bacterium]|jgi:phosphomannomutase|nr:phosphomannomutase [Actinomycetota bacterium]
MNEETAEQIGRAFVLTIADLARKNPHDLKLGLGRDMRLSAPSMGAAYRDGMISEGAHVIDAGQVSTEMLYYLVGSRGLDGGLMCTASHNPKAYTGVKLVREGALPLSGDAGIGDIRGLVEAGMGVSPGGGSHEKIDLWDEFHAEAIKFIDPDKVKPMKIVVDGGNGMAGPMVGPILKKLNMDLIELYFEPNGEFPDHEPNPLLEENRQLIIKAVKDESADLGIAWDGDSDRCFFIDGDGRFCDGDFICALLARAALEAEPGGLILYDPRSSRAVPDVVAAAGGRTDLSRVGHAFFKAMMRKEGAVFGGEVSGHYYFRDFYCADSGTIPALTILQLLSVEGKSLSQMMEEFHSKYFISGEINSEVADPQAKMDEIEAMHPDAEITHLDGVSVDYEDWHFNVRPSNTEPLLRLNLESLVSREDMEQKRDEILAVIRG